MQRDIPPQLDRAHAELTVIHFGPLSDMTECNIRKTLLLVLLAATLVGCNSDRLDKLQKQNQTQLFDLQTKCTQVASDYFKEWRGRTNLPQFGETADWTSHYNQTLTKCFISILENAGVGALVLEGTAKTCRPSPVLTAATLLSISSTT